MMYARFKHGLLQPGSGGIETRPGSAGKLPGEQQRPLWQTRPCFFRAANPP